MPTNRSDARHSLTELAGLFLKLGTIAFGGPAAHIAMMEDEVVRRRGWLTHEEFLDLVGATNLIPGPNSTEMAIHIGHRRVGWSGLVVAGICFILPAAIIVTAIAWAYMRFGKLPQAAGLLYGMKPVIIAVVAQALWRLGRSAVKSQMLAWIGLAVVGLNFLGVNELAVLFGVGLLMILLQIAATRSKGKLASIVPLLALAPQASLLPVTATSVTVATTSFSLLPLFLFF